ncbi:MAG TPA: fumarylacetoacetate hydrolase family protein [Afifellaceae bacterium]|nr:fumarylacetoacetate hydrolase family protein [Afifellaceae bacterium]
MKLVTFSQAGKVCAGILLDGDIAICDSGPDASHAVLAAIADDKTMSEWKQKAESGSERVTLADVELLAPIPEPRRDIYCVGKNYLAHAAEFHSSGFDSSGKEEVPSAPVIFTKAMTSVIGPGAAIRSALDPTGSLDYEGELALVIGQKCFGVSKADAYSVIFGYTIINDATSRDLQKKHNQWVIGKSIDTFCPMGPAIVTADEVGDVAELKLRTTVNGEVRQDALVSDLIFDIPTLIETMSATMTLLPGDIIATGTPVGVGIGFDPPRYLKPGDEVSITISRVGELTNPVE